MSDSPDLAKLVLKGNPEVIRQSHTLADKGSRFRAARSSPEGGLLDDLARIGSAVDQDFSDPCAKNSVAIR